jgi:hypothetical protein
VDPLRKLFRQRFPAFQAAYENRYASTFGRFRLCPSCAQKRTLLLGEYLSDDLLPPLWLVFLPLTGNMEGPL